MYIGLDEAALDPKAFVAVTWQTIYLPSSSFVVTYVLDVAPVILE
jgi:hypothetical protein